MFRPQKKCTMIKTTNTVLKTSLLAAFLISFSIANAQYSDETSPAYSAEFLSGLSWPMNDFKKFADPGFNSSFSINKDLCKGFSFALNAGYMGFSIKDNSSSSNEQWQAFSLLAGPQYQINLKQSFVQFYSHWGLAMVTVPEIITLYPQSELVTSHIKAGQRSGLNTRLGFKLGSTLCEGFKVFLSTDYNTQLNSHINYQSRSLSSAINERTGLDTDLANEIAFENNQFSFSSFNVNVGISISLGSNRAQDHNTSRSNTTSGLNYDLDNNAEESDSSALRAQDHNASRSNTTSSLNYDLDDDTEESDSSALRAQDHNASRSNKSSLIEPSKTATKDTK